MDNNWFYMYDKYNDKYRWVPANGQTAGLYVRMAANSEAWFSPAGYNRGIYKNVVKLMINCDKTDRDTLYKSNVNSIIIENGFGALLLGDKTGLTRPSSFDRINVRMLFIILEKTIATYAKYSMFEMNDEYTRSAFRNRVSQYLRDVKGRRGCDAFLVKCDEENNTANVINSNGFVAAIKVRPLKSINFIELQFASVDYGIEFEEVA
jgi:phage tail sheath protein FI